LLPDFRERRQVIKDRFRGIDSWGPLKFKILGSHKYPLSNMICLVLISKFMLKYSRVL
jgi:hypothetical protein